MWWERSILWALNTKSFPSIEGKIVTFLVEEGQPVEYSQPLIRLEEE